MDYQTLDALRRLLSCVEYQIGGPGPLNATPSLAGCPTWALIQTPDVRVRDLHGAAHALAELEHLAATEERALAGGGR